MNTRQNSNKRARDGSGFRRLGAVVGLFLVLFNVNLPQPVPQRTTAHVNIDAATVHPVPSTDRQRSGPPDVQPVWGAPPPSGAKSEYPLGVNPEPQHGKLVLAVDNPRRLAFTFTSGVLPARARLLDMPVGKYRHLRIEEVWADREQTELLARHTMVGDHLLVSVADGVDIARLRSALPIGFAIRRALHSPGAFLVSFPVNDEDSLPAARAALEKLGPSLVKRAEPDTFVHVASIPNDPLFPEQWGLHNTGQDGGTPDFDIAGPEAWDLRTDASAFPIAVIDTGIDYTHPDLDANIWTNAGETGSDTNGQDKRTNGVDDDNNGFVDDWRGWDFANDDNNPMDDNGHGTHVAGIIGAKGNNGQGIAGVCWTCRMMPLKALTSSGGGAWSDIIDAVAYAKVMKARVGNLSFGAYGASPEEVKSTFESANETLWCAAAGNGELPQNGNLTGDDLDEFHFFPACLDVGHLISATGTGRNDSLAGFANFGKFMVDIAAPGVAIRSTLPGGGYGLNSGTSMACAYVTGACALSFPLRIDPYPLDIRHLVLTTVKRSEGLRNKLVTRGRLDVALLLTQAKSKMEWQMFDSSPGVYLQVRPDGSVVAWGEKSTATGSPWNPDDRVLPTPTEVPLPLDARSVHIGQVGCLAILSDGTVWNWGTESFPYGGAPHALPFTGVRFLSVQRRGVMGVFVINADGNVWLFGNGLGTQLWVPKNDPGDEDEGCPPQRFDRPILQITAGGLFLDSEGSLYQAGYTHCGPSLYRVFAGFPPLDRFTEITAVSTSMTADYAILATTVDGQAYGWGSTGILGFPSFPAHLPEWDGYLRAWGAGNGVYGTMPDGRVVYSGSLTPGVLGTNPVPPAPGSPPYLVGGVTHLSGLVATNDFYVGSRIIAVDRWGRVASWERTSPDEFRYLPSFHDITKLWMSALYNATMFLASDFRSFYTGSNAGGLAGIGIRPQKSRPVEFPAVKGAKHLAVARATTSVTMPDGSLHSWGGGVAGLFFPAMATPYNNVVIPRPAGRFVKESTSQGRLLIMEDGTLWQFAQSDSPPFNPHYQQVSLTAAAIDFVPGGASGSQYFRVVLANGSVVELHEQTPEEFYQVSDDIVAFAGDEPFGEFKPALKRDGTVWEMALSGGNYAYSVQVPGLSGITQIGRAFTYDGRLHLAYLALRNDGRVLVWGSVRGWPALADGRRDLDLAVPAMVDGLTNIVQIASGGRHFLALRADGEVFAWGDNSTGQLGTGDFLSHDLLMQPFGISGSVKIWASGDVSFLQRADGSVWGWGDNTGGMLCDGSALISEAPTLAYGYSGMVFNAGNGFEDWLTTYFNEDELRDIELFADLKDPDDDGLANLEEFAFGTNPRKRTIPFTGAASILPEPTATQEYTRFVPTARLEKVRRNYYSSGVGIAGAAATDDEELHLVMTVPRAERRSDVDYIVEVSDDMEHWHFGPGHTVEVLNTLTNLVVYDARPFEENQRRFIRLRLVRNSPGQTSIPR